MNTWISKGSLVALSLSLLAACDGTPLGLTDKAGQSQALSRAKMASGAVTLVPPQGFCIDRRSVKPGFALMARCDVLGAPPETAIGAPIGIITVSLLKAGTTTPLPSPADTARAASLQDIGEADEAEGVTVFRATGPVPVEGLDPRHWRGTARVGGHILGVALYGPTDSDALSAEGRRITRELIARTQGAS